MTSLYAQCQAELYGYEVIEHGYGYIAFKIEGEDCSIRDVFVRKENRRKGFGTQLWRELNALCSDRGVKRIIGFVDTTHGIAPEWRLVTYINLGAKIVELVGGMIVLQWEVIQNG